jgi:hypothetical protein
MHIRDLLIYFKYIRLICSQCALPLAAGLSTEVWAKKPSFFGDHPTGTNYELSEDAAHVDYFVRRRPPPLCVPHHYFSLDPPHICSPLTACCR